MLVLLLLLTGFVNRVGGALLFGLFFCVPLMFGMSHLHGYIPLAPALGWQACFWLLFVVSIVLPNRGLDIKWTGKS